MTGPSFRAFGMGILASAFAFVCLGQRTLEAQEPDTLRALFALPEMPTVQEEAPPAPPPERNVLIFPGVTLASPAGLGADQGVAYVGAGYQERARYVNDDDGAVFGGIGLGDAREQVGVEVGVTSFSTVRSGLFERTGLSAQVHRFLDENTAIALGVENLVMINGDESDSGRSLYAVGTRIFPRSDDPTEPFSLVVATLGIGDGRFRTEDAILDDRSTIGVFGALSVQVARPLAGIVEWTGQDLALGASIAPFADIPLVITPALLDVTGSAGDGARFAIALGVGRRLSGSGGAIQF